MKHRKMWGNSEIGFLSFIPNNDPEKCWSWTGYKDKDGYGTYRRSHAHRYSYSKFVGQLRKGLYVLHKCDTPECTNPKHLFLGTAKDNYADSKLKERNIHGIKHHQSKLTDEIVRKIRDEYSSIKTSQYILAKRYGVNQSTIGEVIHRETWKHVT